MWHGAPSVQLSIQAQPASPGSSLVLDFLFFFIWRCIILWVVFLPIFLFTYIFILLFLLSSWKYLIQDLLDSETSTHGFSKEPTRGSFDSGYLYILYTELVFLCLKLFLFCLGACVMWGVSCKSRCEGQMQVQFVHQSSFFDVHVCMCVCKLEIKTREQFINNWTILK